MRSCRHAPLMIGWKWLSLLKTPKAWESLAIYLARP
jgi:hypothetical protein